MKGFARVIYWVLVVGIVLFFIGLGIRIAKALIAVAVLVGAAAVLHALFAKPTKNLPPGSGS